MKIAHLRIWIWVLGILCLAPMRGNALPIQRVISPNGIEAWLISDSSLPVIALQFEFRTGSLDDPDQKPGTVAMLTRMMNEGAGHRDAREFARVLEDHAISLSIEADTDSFGGSLKTLSVHRDLAFGLLHDALTKPRYDQDALTRIRDDMRTELQQAMLNPQWQLAHMQRQSLYGNHRLAGRPLQTLKAIDTITASDLEQWRKSHLTRSRLLVTVVGDISADILAGQLDTMFGDLDGDNTLPEISRAVLPDNSHITILDRDMPQALLSVSLPGISRDDPDWFAAIMLDRIYGSGGFQSRLMQKIRVERGLTYGIYSQLVPGTYASTIDIGTSTRPDAVAEIITIIRDEMLRIRKEGVTKAELDDAKSYIAGSFALNMATTTNLAQVLMALRRYDLGIDYLDRRQALIDKVSLDDINRVAQRLYQPEKMQINILGSGITVPGARIIPAPGQGNGPGWVTAIEQIL